MPTFTDEEVLEACPFLESPADLAAHHTESSARKFVLPPHLDYLNDKLLEVTFGELRRLICNMPFGHGKTMLCSNFYPAWKLLWRPEHRFIFGSFGDRFSAKQGGIVKDIINRWGPQMGARLGPGYDIRLRRDIKSKNEWVIKNHEGGMVAKGRKADVVGRPADELLLDDLIKNNTEALSENVGEDIWGFWETVGLGRLMADAPVISVGTRWGRHDWFGRVLAEAKETGEHWEVVKFSAICEEKDTDPKTGLDLIGRKPGQALWEWRRPLAQLKRIREKAGKWWSANWQQDPEGEEGKWFHCGKWPRWSELGGAYCITEYGKARRYFTPQQIVRIVAADWAFGTKTTSDRSAIGVFGLTTEGDLLILEVVNRRLGPHEFAPEMSNVCRKWRPSAVGVEEGHPTFKSEVRRYPEIPEVRWLRPGGKDKLQRAVAAINKGYAGKLILPEKAEKWLDGYVNEISGFSGVDDEHDDCVDMTSWAATMADWWAPLVCRMIEADNYGPELLTAPKQEFWR